MAIERVAVLGGGLMGSGIAESVAAAGVAVIVREVDDEAVTAARGRIEGSLAHAVSRGKLDAGERDDVLSGIEFTTDLGDVADADLVIEAVPEELGLKCAVLADVAGRVSAEAIIASNTSSIPIAQLAAGVPHSERVVGLHFFSPVPVMKLVEVVVALDTSEETLAAAREFAQRIGKVAIETKDRSGFIVNMLLVPYLMAAVRMYEDGFATAEAIDEGMRLGCGHPMGPLTLCDFIGLDVLYSVCDSLYEEFKRPEYAPPPLLKRMVATGRLGKKSGRGFYDYTRARERAAA
ncbi:MAG: 3-hydroxybutyryl-CoA dehydrogenase [Thermoleophilaceae bacterium]